MKPVLCAFIHTCKKKVSFLILTSLRPCCITCLLYGTLEKTKDLMVWKIKLDVGSTLFLPFYDSDSAVEFRIISKKKKKIGNSPDYV